MQDTHILTTDILCGEFLKWDVLDGHGDGIYIYRMMRTYIDDIK